MKLLTYCKIYSQTVPDVISVLGLV